MLKKFTLPILPVEIMDMIVLWAGDHSVAHSLRDRISQYALDHIEKNTLIYGEVRGDKKRVHFSALKNVFRRLYESKRDGTLKITSNKKLK
jgi:hypothetical protein